MKRVRIPAKYVYYYRCPDHRKNYVMSFAFVFDREDEVYQFSYCYPYSYTRLQNYLDNLEKRNYDFLHRELLCLTVVSPSFSFTFFFVLVERNVTSYDCFLLSSLNFGGIIINIKCFICIGVLYLYNIIVYSSSVVLGLNVCSYVSLFCTTIISAFHSCQGISDR